MFSWASPSVTLDASLPLPHAYDKRYCKVAVPVLFLIFVKVVVTAGVFEILEILELLELRWVFLGLVYLTFLTKKFCSELKGTMILHRVIIKLH